MPDNHQARTDPMSPGPEKKKGKLSGIIMVGVALGILLVIAFAR